MKGLNRAQRRRIKMRDLDTIKQRTEDELSSILLCVWLNVLHDDGVEYEKLCELTNKVVDEYERINDDFDGYREKTFERVGITLKRTE